MPSFDVAHIREQGVDLIIFPLEASFGTKSSGSQQDIIGDLQHHSRGAGLAGTVVPVWDNGGGRMAFIAPRNWHSFFKSIDLRFVFANVNKKISW